MKTKQNKNRIVTLVILAFIVVGVIKGVGYQTSSKKTGVITPTPNVVPTTAVVKEEGCKNTALGIEFTYVPNGWTCKNMTTDYGAHIIIMEEENLELSVHEGAYGEYRCSVPSETPYGTCEVKNFFNNENVQTKFYSYTDSRVGIKEGITGNLLNRKLGISIRNKNNFDPLGLSSEEEVEIKKIFGYLVLIK